MGDSSGGLLTSARARLIAGVLALAIAYAIFAKLGLLLAVSPGRVSTAWPAAGIAVGSLLRWGPRLAPGVFLGSLLSNLGTLPFATTKGGAFWIFPLLIIAAGATLQALVGLHLVRGRLASVWPLDAGRGFGGFVLLMGPLASVVNATFGTGALWLTEIIGRDDVISHWIIWWVGDTIGAVIFAPLLLLWTSPFERGDPRRRLGLTAFMIIGVALVVSLFVGASRWEEDRIDAGTRGRLESLVADLERSLDQHVDAVVGVSDALASMPAMDSATFVRLAARARARAPALEGIGWAPAGPQGQLVLALVDPSGAPTLSLGIDLRGAHPWQRAFEEALRSGRLTPADWVGGSDTNGVRKPTSVKLFAPVLAEASAAGTPAPAPPALIGIIVASLRIDALMDATLAGRPREGIELALRDPRAPVGRRVLYRTGSTATSARDHLHMTAILHLAERTWEIGFFATPGYLKSHQSARAMVVLVSGLIFLILLQVFVMSLNGRTARVERLVAERTAELDRSNRELASAVKAKEMLLKELNHRVKNNLQVIASLLSLQARHSADQRYRELFEESHNRVFSIALAHEKLYRSRDLARLDFADYVRALVGHLQSFFGSAPAVSVNVDIRDGGLAVETAIPCGLVINELVTNAFKHAFPNGRVGEVCVEVRELAAQRWLLAVEDDGVGLPADVELGKTGSLGLELVSVLATQISAEVQVNRQRGTRFELTFEEKN